MTAIAWLPWSAESFARARAEGKPVLLSLAPTWCANSAAMEAATFSNPDVIEQVSRRYVPIRVDADRRPDICERYSLGGWPTTAFLSPVGELLGGGTYVAPQRLADVLVRVAAAFGRVGPDTPSTTAAWQTPVPGEASTLPELVERVDATFDAEHGGFGGAPKFPHAAPIQLALALFRDQASERHREMAIRTLDAIGWGPLHDDRDGGFFRCSRARDWDAPEQEKLLDVNASLLSLYTDAFELLHHSRYGDRAEDILRYVQTWLADPADGGWAGSQRADPAYYAETASDGAAAVAAPPVDRTLYTGWNATMASAALKAGRVLDDASLSEFAIRSLERVAVLCYQPGGGVAHYHDGEPGIRGLLADQVAMAEAQLDAFEATGNVVYRMLAEELVLYAIRSMWDESGGGFHDRVADPSQDVGLLHDRRKPLTVNCAAARLLCRTARICGRTPLIEKASLAMAAVRSQAAAAGPLAADLALAMLAAGE